MGSAQDRFGEIQKEYHDRVREWLEEGERTLNAGAAVYVQYAEKHGRRGTGEGMLCLTDRRLLFQFDDMKPGLGGMSVPLSHITHFKSKWIIMPGMRELHVTTNADGQVSKFSYYLGKHVAKELEGQFARLSES